MLKGEATTTGCVVPITNNLTQLNSVNVLAMALQKEPFLKSLKGFGLKILQRLDEREKEAL